MLLLAAAEESANVGMVFLVIGLLLAAGIAVFLGINLTATSVRESYLKEKVDVLTKRCNELDHNPIKSAVTRDIILDGGIVVRIFFPSVSQDNWKCSEALESAVRGLREQHINTREKTA